MPVDNELQESLLRLGFRVIFTRHGALVFGEDPQFGGADGGRTHDLLIANRFFVASRAADCA